MRYWRMNVNRNSNLTINVRSQDISFALAGANMDQPRKKL